MSKRKKEWKSGDVFYVKLENNSYVIGQVLDLQMKNVVRCAFYSAVYNDINKIIVNDICRREDLISLVATTREQLDFGVWEILGNEKIFINQDDYPNEQYRDNGWVGAEIYDASIVEEFLDAYNCLVPWDDWADPNFLDELLVDISKKPKNLILKKV